MSDFIPTQTINWDQAGAVGTVAYGSDQQMVVRFYKDTLRSTQADIANGKPPIVAVDFVSIKEPNDRLHIVVRPVTELDKARWPRHWDLYQKSQAQIPDGTPIEMLFRNEPDVVARLKGGGVFVIEQVAALSEHSMNQFGMGARTWQQRAQTFLDKAGNHEQVAAMEAEMKALRARLEAVEAERLADVQAANRKSRRETAEVST